MKLFGRGRIPVAVIAALWAVSILFYGTIPYQENGYRHWDLSKYLQMAEAAPGIDTRVERPYGERLMGPWLAGVLHQVTRLPLDRSFRLLSLLAAALLLGLLYRFWRRCGLSGVTALLLVAFFVANRTQYGFQIWDYFQLNDWIGLLALVAGLWALHDGRWLHFTLAVLIGVLSREVTLILLPVAAVFLHERGTLRRQGKHLMLVSAAAVAALILLRVAVPGAGAYETWRAPFWFHAKIFQARTWFGWLLNGFAPLTWLPLIFLSETRRFFASSPHLLALVVLTYASTMFASDTERLLAPCAVAFYLLIGRLLEGRGLRAELRLAAVLLPLSMFTAVSHLLPLADRGRLSAPKLPLIVLPAVAAVGWAWQWKRQRKEARRQTIVP
jgi:hypothetical protein